MVNFFQFDFCVDDWRFEVHARMYSCNESCFSVQMIETLGGTTRLAELGMQTLEDGTQLPLPPVLLGHIGQDPQKKTVLIYGHLDVQPAKKVSVLNFLLFVDQE